MEREGGKYSINRFHESANCKEITGYRFSRKASKTVGKLEMPAIPIGEFNPAKRKGTIRTKFPSW